MAENFIGREYVEIKYEVDGLTHTMGFSCELSAVPTPGDDFAALTANTKDGGTTNLLNWINLFVDAMAFLYHTSVSFQEAIVYTVAPNSNVKSFISANVLTGAGISATAPRLAGQEIWTFRSREGGRANIVMMETSSVGNEREPLGSLPVGNFSALRDFIIGDNSIILARDTSYLISGMNRNKGENEATFRKRFRQ